MQCKDKFLLQSTIVPPHTDIDELPQDAVRIFNELCLQSIELNILFWAFYKNDGFLSPWEIDV